MTRSSLVGALALAMLMPSAAFARSDCHQDMKEMLQGTLDMAKYAEAATADDDGSHGCTLVEGQERSPSLDPLSTVRLKSHVFLLSA